jgi:molecular chaperone DnaK
LLPNNGVREKRKKPPDQDSREGLMSHGYAVGIDLGTTNSVVSVYRKGLAETLSVDGRSTVPSVVSFRDDQILVGHQAKARLLADPANSVGSAKRFMGDPKKTFVANGKQYSPVDISAIILQKVVNGASEALGTPVREAVITVPAYFNEAQKLDTRKAGEKIGLHVLRLIPEPTAAAISYGLDKGKDQLILVYDLGGGTFDVSILKVEANNFTVLAVDGDSLLGGDDLDNLLVEHLAALLKKQAGVDLYVPGKGILGMFDKDVPKEKLIALQRLKETAETAKIELSQSISTEVIIPNLMGHPFEAEITRAEFDAMTAPCLERTIHKVRDVLKAAKLSSADIDRVILVGGSTRIPRVRELISETIKDPYTSDKVDEIVSNGAAIMAANLFLPKEDADRTPIEVTNVQPHSLGIDMRNERMELEFTPIIPRNSALPCKGGVLGQTIDKYQPAVCMKVFRGENSDPHENEYLGELLLHISKPSESKIPIAAVFELDVDGILHFTAIEVALNEHTIPYLEKATRSNSIVLQGLGELDHLVQQGYAKSKKIQIEVTKSPDIEGGQSGNHSKE